MKILITGAGGQLGTALGNELQKHHLLPLGHERLDVTNFEAVSSAVNSLGPDLIINCAAYNNVDGAESDQESAFRLNSLAPRNLAVASFANDIPLLHVSTDYVFDGMSDRPYHEFDRPNPISVYAKSKLAGEIAVASLNPRHYLVRTSWLYHFAPASARNFPKTMLGLAGKDQVNVVSDQFGSPTFVPHLAKAIGDLIETNAFGLYHLAGSGFTSWYELTRTLFRLFDIKTFVNPVSTAEFPRLAPRPGFSALTTLQDPGIVLPHWETGLSEFAAGLK